MKSIWKEIVLVIILIAAVMAGTALLALIIKVLWNDTLVKIALVNPITYWQSVKLMLLLHISTSGLAQFVKAIWDK